MPTEARHTAWLFNFSIEGDIYRPSQSVRREGRATVYNLFTLLNPGLSSSMIM